MLEPFKPFQTVPFSISGLHCVYGAQDISLDQLVSKDLEEGKKVVPTPIVRTFSFRLESTLGCNGVGIAERSRLIAMAVSNGPFRGLPRAIYAVAMSRFDGGATQTEESCDFKKFEKKDPKSAIMVRGALQFILQHPEQFGLYHPRSPGDPILDRIGQHPLAP